MRNLVCIFLFSLLIIWVAIFARPLANSKHSAESLAKRPDNAFVNSKGYHLEQISYNPNGETTANLFFAHGFAEYCTRPGYKIMFQELADKGIAVHCINHQGHGNSYGDRNHVERFDDYITDFIEFTLHILQKDSNDKIPTFLAGHSMGSLIATKTFLKRPDLWDAVALVGFCAKLDEEKITPTLIWMANAMSNYLPKIILDRLDLSGVSRNESACFHALSDPLHKDTRVRARYGAEFMKAALEIYDRMGELNQPFAFFHGNDDDLCLPQGSSEIFEKTPSTDKKLFLYDGMRHEPFEDPEYDLFFNDFYDWFNSHI